MNSPKSRRLKVLKKSVSYHYFLKYEYYKIMLSATFKDFKMYYKWVFTRFGMINIDGTMTI